MNIRDIWNGSDSEHSRAAMEVEKLIGYSVHIEPEWELLWNELKGNFQDPGTFIPTISSILAGWCTSLSELAGRDENEEWTEELLENLKTRRRVNVIFEVRENFAMYTDVR
jgi:hypothetical protein